MKLETLTLIRNLRRNADAIGGFYEKWRTKYLADSHCDKKGASFLDTDDRFTSFSFTLRFVAYAGYYGNSSCGTIAVCDKDFAQKYLTRAIEEKAPELFALAAELMRADAAQLRDKAAEEIAGLQRLVDELDADDAAKARAEAA